MARESARIVLLALAMWLMAAPIARALPLQPGDYQFALAHQGRSRNYLAHIPPHAEGVALPVVLNFHGGGGDAEGQSEHTQMNPAADREGFIVVYPNGTGFFRNRLLTWNAGTCCGYAMKNKVDDVGFTFAVLDDLATRISLDRKRVYATGHSNGAMMAYRLAVDAGDRIAAIAPVAGGMVVTDFHPSRPMPIMHFHSVDDPRALYEGGLGPPFPFTTNRVMHPNVE
ncbi:MAG TPA: PHB depolymerase family esterase, partial [Candidatus Binataceae bacterium]|nr:PHB depolymerase family esterase [Candidatus Binataceae bacterium]